MAQILEVNAGTSAGCHNVCRNLVTPGCRTGNHLQLCVGGESFVPAMLTAIAEARNSVDLELYRAHPGNLWRMFEAALVEATLRGVRVRLLFDAFGSRGLPAASQRRLSSLGVELRLFRPLLASLAAISTRRDHRKLLVTDATTAFIGGMSIDDIFYRNPNGPTWHDAMVRVEGPLVEEMRASFTRSWHHIVPVEEAVDHGEATLARAWPGTSNAHLISSTIGCQDGENLFLNALHQARSSVMITNPFVIPTRKIRRAFRDVVRNGIDVRILVPGRFSHFPVVYAAMQSFYDELLSFGVRIFEYGVSMLHAKIVVVDRHWSYVGSLNMDPRSLFRNEELGLGSCDASFAESLALMFIRDCENSEEVHLCDWRKRGTIDRLRQAAATIIRSHL